MIDNKQINLWRGSSSPPTIYHIWINNNNLILKYNEANSKWEVVLDLKEFVDKLNQVLDYIDKVDNYTINGYKISNNPILKDSDIKISLNKTFITNNVADSLVTLDSLLTTKIIE